MYVSDEAGFKQLQFRHAIAAWRWLDGRNLASCRACDGWSRIEGVPLVREYRGLPRRLARAWRRESGPRTGRRRTEDPDRGSWTGSARVAGRRDGEKKRKEKSWCLTSPSPLFALLDGRQQIPWMLQVQRSAQNSELRTQNAECRMQNADVVGQCAVGCATCGGVREVGWLRCR